jgi:uncharacterized OB-fold protein
MTQNDPGRFACWKRPNLLPRIAAAQALRPDLLRGSGVPPCGGIAGPLTPDGQMSHQDCNTRATRPTLGEEMTDMAEPARARPKPTPETQHFWDGTQAGELRLQRCDACANVYFPPRPFCPACASRKVSIFKASGKAKLYSYVIHHRPVPGFTPPYAIAVVELDEGPRMMSNIVDCPQTPEALELDMKLEVRFEKLDDKITLPLFRPAKG